jgi:hypothetical protein
MSRLSNSLFAFLLVSFLTGTALAGPKLQIPETTFNFGRVPQQVIVTHGFWLKSVGDDTVRISSINTGCGCTQIPLEDSTIAPGDSLQMQIVLNTGRYRGYVSKKPQFISNASDQPTVLRIYAEAITNPNETTLVAVRPVVLDLSQHSPEPVMTGKIALQNTAGEEVNVKPTDTSSAEFTVTVPGSIPADESGDIVVTLNDSAIETSFARSITIEVTSSSERATYSIPVFRRYEPNGSEAGE